MQKAEGQISEIQSDILIAKTKGCCSTCFKVIPAEIVDRKGKVFMLKECHGKEEVLIENDAEYFKQNRALSYYDRTFLKLATSRFEGQNLDGFLANTPSILITVTLRCNLNCPICLNTQFPSLVNHQTDVIMPLGKIKNMLVGHRRKSVTIWGGEPTLRKDLPEIIRAVQKSGNTTSLCTNGLKLLDINYCKTLKETGLPYVDLQFDGFRDDIYIKYRGTPLLEKKMKILKNLKTLKMKTNLLAVIGRGVNEDQIPLILKFATLNKDFINSVLLIDLYTGNLGDDGRLTYSDIIKHIERITNTPGLALMTFRLYMNLGNVVGKLSKRFSMLANSIRHQKSIHLRKTDEGLRPYLNIQWLKRTNEILEESLSKNKIECVMHLIKNAKHFLNKDFIDLAMPVVLNGFDVFKGGAALDNPNIIKVLPCSTKSPLTEDLEYSCFHEDFVTEPLITNTVGITG